MPFRFPVLLVPAALVALSLTGCTAESSEPDSWYTPGAVIAATPTPSAPEAVADAAAPLAAAPTAPVAAAPASVDYVGPVSRRWGGCFGRLGIGDIYYDSTLGVVTAAWKNGVITWSVSPEDKTGTPADQASTDALAGC